jgi:hypothetical protein
MISAVASLISFTSSSSVGTGLTFIAMSVPPIRIWMAGIYHAGAHFGSRIAQFHARKPECVQPWPL